MNNKKLTLKLLQQQLEELKIKTIANKKINNKLPTAAQRAEVISKKGKNMPKASMSFNPLGILMSLSWISFILSKFPFLTTLFTKILGIKKASILFTILIYLRKGFIVTNAIIGIWLMFKVTGWDQGSFLMSAAAIGHSYMEFFITFIYKAFNYLYNIFDNKIIPNIGSGQNPYSVYNGWNIRPMKDNNYLSIAENAKSWYTSPINQVSDSWFDNWKTWIYVAFGLVTIVAFISGAIYINNWLWQDPSLMDKGKLKDFQLNVESPGGTIYPSSKSVLGKIGDVLIFNRLNNISEGASYIKEKIIPSMDTDQFNRIQYEGKWGEKIKTYYPFTNYDPSAPWYERIRMKLFPEAKDALNIRLELKRNILGTIPEFKPNFVQGSSSVPIDNKGNYGGPYSPGWANVDLNTPPMEGFKTNAAPIRPLSPHSLDVINFNASRPATVTSFLGNNVKTEMASPIMDRINDLATQHKLNNPLLSTPKIPPLSLETIAEIDSVAANVDSSVDSASNTSNETVTDSKETKRLSKAERAAHRAARLAIKAAKIENE